MKRLVLLLAVVLAVLSGATAQTNQNRLSAGIGALYQRGLDATLSAEHTTRYHHAWEYFVNGYVQWTDCTESGHVCPDSFWRNYRTWEVASPTNPASPSAVPITAVCASGPAWAAIPTTSSAASTSATSTTTPSVTDGASTGRPRPTSCSAAVTSSAPALFSA